MKVDFPLECPGVTFFATFDLTKPLGMVFDTVFVTDAHNEVLIFLLHSTREQLPTRLELYVQMCAVVRRFDALDGDCQATQLGVQQNDIILQVDGLPARQTPTQ